MIPTLTTIPLWQLIQEVVDGYPGLYRDLLTYLRERIKEVLTGSSATLVIRIYGENLDVLNDKAGDVYQAISDVEGVIDFKIQPQILVPHVEVHFRAESGALFGLTAGRVREEVSLMMKGVKVGEFYENQNIFDVVVWGEPQVRGNLDALRSMRISTPTGGLVPLSEVADVYVLRYSESDHTRVRFPLYRGHLQCEGTGSGQGGS